MGQVTGKFQNIILQNWIFDSFLNFDLRHCATDPEKQSFLQMSKYYLSSARVTVVFGSHGAPAHYLKALGTFKIRFLHYWVFTISYRLDMRFSSFLPKKPWVFCKIFFLFEWQPA